MIEGRLDDQVKIRGFRVELGDVTHQLQRIADVEDAVVLSVRMHDGESQLIAYLVGPQGSAHDTAAVRSAMAAALPVYMVPSLFIWLPRLPLLPNGKIDRSALTKLGMIENSADASIPLDATEASIVKEWKLILGRPSIDADCSFVDLGGDSLSFIEASTQLETLLGALPDRWEKLSIRALARKKRDKRSRWTSIDSSVLLRAISIVAVVAGHFNLPNLAGSVRALFVVSGMSFGRYVVPQVLRSERIFPITRLVLKIAVPAVLYALLVNIIFGLPKWPGVLLMNNLVSPDSKTGGVGFWYVDVLLQCYVVFGALLCMRWARQIVSRNSFQFALSATLLFVAIAFIAPYIWDTSQLYDRVPQANLGIICLGWAVMNADTPRRKLIVMTAAVLTFADAAWHSESLLVLPFVATFFLLLCSRVSLPLHVGRLVNLLASASLFIYLMDHQIGLALTKAGLGNHSVVMLVIAVAIGVAAWRAWESGSSAAMRWQRQVRAKLELLRAPA